MVGDAIRRRASGVIGEKGGDRYAWLSEQPILLPLSPWSVPMTGTRTVMYSIALALALPAAALAQAPAKTVAPKPKPKVESQAALAKLAKVSLDSATAVALSAVAGATVKSHELEREKGKLIYSFDMKIAGKAGIEEVNVDAMTGATVGKVEHEDDPAPAKATVKKP
jgi:hypothetical protein